MAASCTADVRSPRAAPCSSRSTIGSTPSGSWPIRASARRTRTAPPATTGSTTSSPRGLFSRAAVHSGFCLPVPREAAFAKGRAVQEELGCDAIADPLDCMRDKSAEEVVRTSGASLYDRTGDRGLGDYNPSVDGVIVTGDALSVIESGAFAHMPIVMGTTADEYAALVDFVVGMPLQTEAEYLAAARAFLGGD